MHDVLERLFSELKTRKVFPLRPESLEPVKRRARQLLDEEVAKLTSAGTIVHPGLVGAVRDQMEADLYDLLEREVEDAGDFVPDRFELEFTGLPFDAADCCADREFKALFTCPRADHHCDPVAPVMERISPTPVSIVCGRRG